MTYLTSHTPVPRTVVRPMNDDELPTGMPNESDLGRLMMEDANDPTARRRQREWFGQAGGTQSSQRSLAEKRRNEDIKKLLAFMRANPGCTKAQMRIELDANKDRVRTVLASARGAGHTIKSHRKTVKGVKVSFYRLVEE